MSRPLTAAAAALIAAASSAAAEAPVEAAVEVEPEAYLGLWYEIARTPAPFQELCAGGVTAFYEQAEGGTVRVLNRCDLPDGEAMRVEGRAEPADGDFGRLDVEFPQSPEEDGVNYVVAALGPVEDGRYAWAAVVGGEAEIGWILARAPELDAAARAEATAALEAAGVDVSALEDTPQPPRSYDPADT